MAQAQRNREDVRHSGEEEILGWWFRDAGGARFQNQVGAWLATKMLAERVGDPIAPRGKIIYIRPESGAAVDDILVGTEGGQWGFIQVKRKISLSAQENSDLASVVDELVRQINLPAESEGAAMVTGA